MELREVVKELVLKYGNMTSEEDLLAGYKSIAEPNPGDVVFYKENDVFKKVEIAGGTYLDPKHGRLCNFWAWREIDESGRSIPALIHGYGNFFKKII